MGIWNYTFYKELGKKPEESDVFLTEPPLNAKAIREKMTKIMFETFNVPRFYIGISSVLSLFAAGRTTGIVLESGYGLTHITPIYEAWLLPHAVQRLELGGFDITNYLIKQLKFDANYASIFGSNSNATTVERETVALIKEKLCYVATDYDTEIGKANNGLDLEKVYELPDGSHITLNEQRFGCTEIMFKPYLFGKEEQDGIVELLNKSVIKCDIDIREDLYNNIVLNGGNTMFNGMTDRIKKDLLSMIPEDTNLTIVSPPERCYSAWIGGSILCSLSTFEEMWITNQEYDESGPRIVHRKCN